MYFKAKNNSPDPVPLSSYINAKHATHNRCLAEYSYRIVIQSVGHQVSSDTRS